MIILSLIFGLLIGNYTTTFLFRLPRNIEICGINKSINTPPCCSTCRHPLKFYEYLPVLSWIFVRFKCNYCGAKINLQYFILEFTTGLISIVLFLLFNFSEIYLLFLILWSLLIIAGLIEYNSSKIYNNLTFGVITTGMIYRTLLDSSILFFIRDIAIIAIFLSMIMNISRLQIKKIIHLTLQASVFGLGEVMIVLSSLFITEMINKKNSYLYSLVILYFAIVLKAIIAV
jgi:leader peptidase (prepilin peptidase)/N-methyltransferase